MGEYEFENLFDDLGNADFLMEADLLFQAIRLQIRVWIRGVDKVTLEPTSEAAKTIYVSPKKLPPI